PWPYRDGPLLDPGRGWEATGVASRAGSGHDRLSAFLPYEAMDLAEIAALPVRSMAAPAAHVYLWTTNRFLWDGPAILNAWGVKPLQVLTWCKAPMGLGPGSAFANTTEFVLFGRSRTGPLILAARETAGLGRADLHRLIFDTKPTGLVYRWEADDCLPTVEQWDALRRHLPALADDLTPEPNRHPSSWFAWKRGEHSQKPEAFIDLVEQVSPGPYVELFARRHRLGWDVYGNQSANTAVLPLSADPAA
ncbi:MAG TPA: MT-A70 family methyltransferase, partial [Rhodothermales bacterium]|nr:MT-A70 family methyltransferase [Rhodothermales bacterium]